MSDEIFTGEWAEAWCREVNESEAYREAAADWEGAVVLTVEPDPSYGVETARSVWVDLRHGECREARRRSATGATDRPWSARSRASSADI